MEIFEISLHFWGVYFTFACPQSIFIGTAFSLFIVKLWLKAKDRSVLSGEPYRGGCLHVILCFSSEMMLLLCIYIHIQICLTFSGEKKSILPRKTLCCKWTVGFLTVFREEQRLTLKNMFHENPKPPPAFSLHSWKWCLWIPLDLKEKRRFFSSYCPWQ